jgi:hypothetical protein
VPVAKKLSACREELARGLEEISGEIAKGLLLLKEKTGFSLSRFSCWWNSRPIQLCAPFGRQVYFGKDAVDD